MVILRTTFYRDLWITIVYGQVVQSDRGSGGVTVFVKGSLSNTNYIHRMYNEWSDWVILFVNRILTGLEKDLILLLTYVSPERYVIYENKLETVMG